MIHIYYNLNHNCQVVDCIAIYNTCLQTQEFINNKWLVNRRQFDLKVSWPKIDSHNESSLLGVLNILQISVSPRVSQRLLYSWTCRNESFYHILTKASRNMQDSSHSHARVSLALVLSFVSWHFLRVITNRSIEKLHLKLFPPS